MSQDHLTQEQLSNFKSRLLEMKEEIMKDLSKADRDNAQDAIHELADFQNHPADEGTEQFEQELDKGFIMMSEDKLEEVNNALKKISEGTYGFSEKSGEPIPVDRLQAEPTARNRIEED